MGEKACLEATLSVCKARLLLLEPEPLLPPWASVFFSCFCRRDYQGEIAILFYFLAGCKAAMNSARTRYVIHILPVLRGQIEVAKRMGRVLCMPTFPVASPVQPADCNLPPAELRPTFHRKRGLVPLQRNASLQPGLPQQENGTSLSWRLWAVPPSPLRNAWILRRRTSH
ncbi:putative Sterile alpha motif domain-containing protein [Naja naja]|nr:putative Sterile alpha motif domain-containing protein [Naja naja]